MGQKTADVKVRHFSLEHLVIVDIHSSQYCSRPGGFQDFLYFETLFFTLVGLPTRSFKNMPNQKTKTRRECLKSVLYLRLKKRKVFKKCQDVFMKSTEN